MMQEVEKLVDAWAEIEVIDRELQLGLPED